ncbi:MAG: PIN domain-containing protein [Desulfurococcales archaeon]|nr:PIN domain-containing protein [Desulfurococcales archaeon]
MNRKIGINSGTAILIDSTYLLPVFGIEVIQISDEILLKLRRLALEKLITLYYSPVSFIEITAKIARETIKKGSGPDPSDIANTIRAIEETDYLKPIYPDAQAYALAYKMKLLGHRDMIDNILYATASTRGAIFITIDESFKNFVQHHRIKGARVLSHYEFIEELEA